VVYRCEINSKLLVSEVSVHCGVETRNAHETEYFSSNQTMSGGRQQDGDPTLKISTEHQATTEGRQKMSPNAWQRQHIEKTGSSAY
jgi:hypothetical protein